MRKKRKTRRTLLGGIKVLVDTTVSTGKSGIGGARKPLAVDPRKAVPVSTGQGVPSTGKKGKKSGRGMSNSF